MPNDVRSFGREVQHLRVSAEVHRLEQYWQHLDSAERRRADRFRNEADRARFVIARSSLRQLLGRRIGVASGEITFGENEFGKPLVQNSPVVLHFNSSHSGDWVLHAIDAAAPIGIDVEAVHSGLTRIDQFERVLSPEEFALLNDLPAIHRALAFARVWVRKEAYVKALGEGLSRPLRDISVIVDATGHHPRLLYDRNAGYSPSCWRFRDVDVDPHHVACMVYRKDVERA
jgi:4'-phosphopantetheinyl transferase